MEETDAMLFQLLFGASRIVACTVHEGPNPPTDRMDRAEALRFVRDGFSGQAALLAPIWLLAHRLWPALAAYIAAIAAIGAAYAWLGLPDAAALICVAAVHLIVGFEADTIERGDLERKGWSGLGSVTGANLLECQRRFFEQWLPSQPVFTSKATTAAQPPAQTPRPQVTSARGGSSAADRLAALWRR
jgi:hypothetical protein